MPDEFVSIAIEFCYAVRKSQKFFSNSIIKLN